MGNPIRPFDGRSIPRFAVFNLVGAGGMVLQLLVLGVLTKLLGLGVLAATIIAVEIAVLHNFYWHHVWTWRDRPAGSTGELVQRLVRFNTANGGISLVGNAIITSALATGMRTDPLIANLVAIAVCAMANYFTGDLYVFRASAAAVIMLITIGGSEALFADQPQAAQTAWQQHVATVEARHDRTDGAQFFALDAQRVARWQERARSGDVPMVEVSPPSAPDAKIHHWAGAVYVPHTTVEAVVRRMQQYAGRESEFYEEVKASRLLQRDGDRLRVYMRLYRDAGPVEATYNTEHAVEYRRLSPTRAISRSISTKIAELDRPGKQGEREKAPGEDSGFLWRLNAYWRFEQAGDGVLIECESVSLSRGVPYLLRPIATPIVNRIARESLQRTLRSLRTFLSGPRA